MGTGSTALAAETAGPRGAARGLVVWLHGLGASGHDFAPVVPMLGLPDVRFVFPHAPPQPVTINGGYVMPAWYDIRSLGPGPEREDRVGLGHSVAAVEALIEAELAAGAAAERVVIAGFSQGGAVALELLMRSERRFRGGIALSTYEVGGGGPPTAANASTPVFFGHGRYDDVVPAWRGRAAHDALVALGRPCTWHEYGMGHEVCLPEIEAIGVALREWLPPR